MNLLHSISAMDNIVSLMGCHTKLVGCPLNNNIIQANIANTAATPVSQVDAMR